MTALSTNAFNGARYFRSKANKNLHTPLEAYSIGKWNDNMQKYREQIARERDNPFIIKAMKEVFTEEEISEMVNTHEKIAMAFIQICFAPEPLPKSKGGIAMSQTHT